MVFHTYFVIWFGHQMSSVCCMGLIILTPIFWWNVSLEYFSLYYSEGEFPREVQSALCKTALELSVVLEQCDNTDCESQKCTFWVLFLKKYSVLA